MMVRWAYLFGLVCGLVMTTESAAQVVGPDEDCNGNGIPDVEEALDDCNQNGVPDVCELEPPTECADERSCVIGGLPTTALGQATLAVVEIGPRTTLLVDNIGSSGEDGVRQDLGGLREKTLRLVRPNLSETTEGARLSARVEGVSAAVGEEPFGAELGIRDSGFGFLLNVAAAGGVATYDVLILNDGDLVALESGLDAAQMATARADIETIAFRSGDTCIGGTRIGRPCDTANLCPLGACEGALVVDVRFAASISVNIPGRGESQGNQVRVIPRGLGAGVLNVFSLVAGDLERVLIDVEEADPGVDLVDCDQNGRPDSCDIADGAPDCNRNGVPDACEIADGAADCNQNDVLDACELELLGDCDQSGVLDLCEIRDGVVADCNQNGVPDACELATQPELDCDSDGRIDSCAIDDGTVADCDRNGVPDTCDVKEGAVDCNQNDVPDACEELPDCNQNDVPDSCEIAAGDVPDCNQNGVPDACEADTLGDCNDNDIPDACEIRDGAVADCNENGTPDVCEIDALSDCNQNGIPDACEIRDGAIADCNENGTPDVCEADELGDCNQNGIPDACEIRDGAIADCNGNGVPDSCEVDDGQVADCNQNGIPDSCDVADGQVADCNQNGIPDSCEIEALDDCNENGVPDACEVDSGAALDCNQNGVPDSCDLALGETFDCDGNGVIDSCEIGAGVALDCNQNEVPDACDIRSGVSLDVNENGVPDECPEDQATAAEVYEQTIESALRLRDDDIVPQETVDFFLENEAEFSTDLDALFDAVRVVESEVRPDIRFGDGAAATTGLVDGQNILLYNNRRIPVGIMRVVVFWSNNNDPCTSEIVDHFFMGGVINGVCTTNQISGISIELCPPTGQCGAPIRECADFQVACTQLIGSRTTMFTTPTERLCAQCAEFPGGRYPGDCNADGFINIADASCVFGFLFLGVPADLPCGDGSAADPANLSLLDWNGDTKFDISDGIGTLNWLFSGAAASGAPHVLGRDCVQILGCAEDCNGT